MMVDNSKLFEPSNSLNGQLFSLNHNLSKHSPSKTLHSARKLANMSIVSGDKMASDRAMELIEM